MWPKITLTDAPPPEMWNAIFAPLAQFNMVRLNRTEVLRPLVITLANPAKQIIGGLYGGTLWDYLRIDLLFVPEMLRGTGIGRRLMIDAEAEAVQRGCHAASLDTYSFQARDFYERLGYTVFGTLEDCPRGHRRFFMSKQLAPAEARPRAAP